MMIDLKHEGCGGWWQKFATRGLTIAVFRCEKCNKEIEVPCGDEGTKERRRAKREKQEEQMKNWTPPPPPVPLRRATAIEGMLLSAYRGWSEEHYAAGFMSPDDSIIERFLSSMQNANVMEGYELEFLEMVAKAQGVTV